MPSRAQRRASRRAFLEQTLAVGVAAGAAAGGEELPTEADLAAIAARPVLDVSFVAEPVRIASVELLRQGNVHLVRLRSADGVEAVTVPNPARMALLGPVFIKQVAPVFLGRDARDLERLLWDAYRYQSNYKMQGLALWVCVAAMEMAVLELLGQSAGRPLADFFGGSLRRDVPIYVASSNRGNEPAAEIDHLRSLVEAAGARALKWRPGGRMSRNADSRPGRSEALIPGVRAAFGAEMTLYADANSSYDPPTAIRLGRMMEEQRYGFFEEPCEFDDLWGTKAVADALTLPVAGGEEEFSLHRWRWLIANRAVDIVQPDLHYGGGLVRATQVARMAAAAGLKVVPHMSGGGLGYLDVVHFACFMPNIGEFMEFKGNADLPVSSPTSSLRCERGQVRCPTGPGLGVTIDPDYIAGAVPVEGAIR